MEEFAQLCRESLPAAYEMARQLGKGRGKPQARSAESVWRLMQRHYTGVAKELFIVLLLDGKHRVLREAQVSMGTVTSTLVHPREVFVEAIKTPGCAAIVLSHNHPSGDPEPSAADLDMTKRLVRAGKLLGIPVLDHVISGHTAWVSVRERMGGF